MSTAFLRERPVSLKGVKRGRTGRRKKSPQEEFFASLGLEKVVLGEDDLREIEEYREAMKNAGLGAEQIEEAVRV